MHLLFHCASNPINQKDRVPEQLFHIKEKETGFLYFKDLELHTIELKKFSNNGREEAEDLIAKVKNSLDMWVAFLTRHDLLNKDHLPSTMNNPILRKALNVVDVMSFSDQEREIYEGYLKWLRIKTNTIKKYEAKGFSEGWAKGIAYGKAKEIAEGSKHAAIQIAQAMLAQGMSTQQVQAITGLSAQEIIVRNK